MKSDRDIVRRTAALQAGPGHLLITVARMSPARGNEPPANVVIWDTQSHFAETVDVRGQGRVESRAHRSSHARGRSRQGLLRSRLLWQRVCLRGRRRRGERPFHRRVLVGQGTAGDLFENRSGPGDRGVSLLLQTATAGIVARFCGIPGAKQPWRSLSGKDLSAVVAFDRTEIIEIKPGRECKGIRVQSPIEYGVAPDFIGDDLIIAPASTPRRTRSCPGRESLPRIAQGREPHAGHDLAPGKTADAARAWASRNKGLGESSRSISSTDGQSVYLALLEAPGIWHREPLTASFLEKDVTIDWKRPFPARWITQLEEAGLRTTIPLPRSQGPDLARRARHVHVSRLVRRGQGLLSVEQEGDAQGRIPHLFPGGTGCRRSRQHARGYHESDAGPAGLRHDPRPPRPQAPHPSSKGRRGNPPGLHLRLHGGHRGRLQCRTGGREERVYRGSRRRHGLLRHPAPGENRRVPGLCRRHGEVPPCDGQVLAGTEALPRQPRADRQPDPGQYEVQKENIKSLAYADELAAQDDRFDSQRRTRRTCRPAWTWARNGGEWAVLRTASSRSTT